MLLFRLTVALALAILLTPFGCHQTVPDPIQPIPVRDVDLMTIYRDDWPKARLAYDGQQLRLLVQTIVRIDSKHLGIPVWAGKPCVVILTFVEAIGEQKSPIWVTGKCEGKVLDGVDRMLPGFEFYISISECVISEQKASP